MPTIGSLLIRILADAEGLKNELERSGKLTDDFEKNLQRAGKIGMAALAAIGTTAIATGVAIVALTKSVAEHGEELAKMSAFTGQSVEALSELAFAAELADVDMNSMGRATKALSNAMYEASTGSGTAGAAFTAMGISIRGSHGELRSSLSVMMDVADAFSKMTDETKRSAYASQLFGKASQELVPMLAKGSAEIKALMLESRELGNTWSTESAAAAAQLSDDYKRLSYAAGQLLETAMRPLIPVMDEIVNDMLDWIKANKDWLATELTNNMNDLADSIRNVWSALKDTKAAYDDLRATPIADFIVRAVKAIWAGLKILTESILLSFLQLAVNINRGLEAITFGDLHTKVKAATKSLEGARDAVKGWADSASGDLFRALGLLEEQSKKTGTAGATATNHHANAMKTLSGNTGVAIDNQKILGEQIVKYTQILNHLDEVEGKRQERMGRDRVDQTKLQLKLEADANAKYFESLGDDWEGMEKKAAYIREKQFTTGFRAPGERASYPGGPLMQQYEAVPGVSVAKFQEAAGHAAFQKLQDDIDASVKLYDELEGAQLGAAENMLPKSAIDKANANYQEYLGQLILGSSRFSDKWTTSMQLFQDSALFAFGSIRTSFGNTLVGLAQGTATWADFWMNVQGTLLNVSIQTGLNIAVEYAKNLYKEYMAKQAIEALKTNAQILGDQARVASATAAQAEMTAVAEAGAVTQTGIFEGAMTMVQGYGATVMTALKTMAANLIEIMTAVGEWVIGVLSAIAEALADTGIGIPWAVAIVAGIAAIVAALAAAKVIKFAEGGMVTGPTLGLLGERGPELVTPLDRLDMFGGGGVQKIIVPVYLDRKEIARVVADALPSALRRQGVPF